MPTMFERLNYLDDLAEEYKKLTGSLPFSLSHWNPSEHTINALLPYLRLPPLPFSPMPYIYSHEESKPKVIGQLGFSEANRKCIYVQSGTNAILLAAWWLKELNLKRIIVVCPVYFSTLYAFEILDLSCECLYMHRNPSENNWSLPRVEIEDAIGNLSSQTGVWITNPVYSTSNYLSDGDTKFLQSLLQGGVAVVVDECLCINRQNTLGGKLALFEKFIGIYSPHKSVSVNSVKFGALIIDVKYENFFDCWSDVLVGGLSASNYSAILHFLGDNFSQFSIAFLDYTNHARDKVTEMIREASDFLQTDVNREGQYITCYAPKLAGILGTDNEFLFRLLLKTGALVIPGVLNFFPEEVGFCFRINLSKACPQFFSSLQRTINYLALLSA